jgi:hypothetical protein
MRMFHQFLKTFKEENNVEDSGEEQNSNSSEFSLDTTSLCGENRHLFGHDPITTQDALDALDAIPGIETSQNSIIDPHVSLIVDSRSRHIIGSTRAPPKVCLSFAKLLVALTAG